VRPGDAKKGHMLCRKMAKGQTIEGIESKKFHKFLLKGTNCVWFAMQVLEKIGVKPDKTMMVFALTSPPEALKLGRLTYLGKRW
jgi:hypothetical protein